MEDLEFNDQHDNKIQDGEITVVRHEIEGVDNNNSVFNKNDNSGNNIFDEKLMTQTVKMMIPILMTNTMANTIGNMVMIMTNRTRMNMKM